jgi:hypothetical protein
MSDKRYFGVGEVARLCGPGVRSRDVSDLFWLGALDADLCPVVSGRRVVPLSYVATVKRVLQERRAKREKAEAATAK